MHILLTGGTGLIGRHLIPILINLDHHITVLTRNPLTAAEKIGNNVTLLANLQQLNNLNDIDAVINLAGEPIADKRWSTQHKQRLCDSRWRITEQLASLISISPNPPSIFISGSACGFYGDRGDERLTEEDTGQNEFTHHLCARWESLALAAQSEKTRVCLLRTGMVLAKKGGALSRMKIPFYLGLGGQIGNGNQYLPWIHIEDMVNAIIFLLKNDSSQGPFNMVAPQVVSNREFANAMGRALHRPSLITTPACVLRLLMGESSVLLLGGQHVIAEKLLASSFTFRWPQLDGALKDLL